MVVLKAESAQAVRVLFDRGVRRATDRLLDHDLELQQLYQCDEVVCRITFSVCCNCVGRQS